MQNFLYKTRPLPGMNRYTGQPKYRGIIRANEVISSLATISGVDPAQVEAVLRALGPYVVDETLSGRRIEPLFHWLGFQATCGGSHSVPDFQPTYDNLKMDIRVKLGKLASNHAKLVFRAECTGHNSRSTPTIVRATNMHNGLACCYTPGKPMQIELADGRGEMDLQDDDQGIFFKAGNGQKKRVSDYGYVRGANIICNAPLGLTGDQELCVALMINGSIRSSSYPEILSYAAPTDSPPESEASNGSTRANARQGKGPTKDIALPS